MCRRCVIHKGRAVGKSTDLGNSLAIVLAHDQCVHMVPVDPETMKKVREGKFKDVSMSSYFTPGKTVKELKLGKKFEELRAKMSPERRQKNEEAAKSVLAGVDYAKGKDETYRSFHDDKGVITSADPEARPDWDTPCENCGEVPTLPVTGMCGPCTFGEAETAGGNW